MYSWQEQKQTPSASGSIVAVWFRGFFLSCRANILLIGPHVGTNGTDLVKNFVTPSCARLFTNRHLALPSLCYHRPASIAEFVCHRATFTKYATLLRDENLRFVTKISFRDENLRFVRCISYRKSPTLCARCSFLPRSVATIIDLIYHEKAYPVSRLADW